MGTQDAFLVLDQSDDAQGTSQPEITSHSSK